MTMVAVLPSSDLLSGGLTFVFSEIVVDFTAGKAEDPFA